ncbi:hypothetical protein LRS74_12665 [Streptomyces sp. LX-29]|uniref:hypothetical protein n=1 Tax=Streptomyces sp. LX-29 TaxID=2900152 RepID=UPI00240D1561|nr:hypothetical protein [Streptomyces sp. LX-29]WFB07801.1 hypothetical protein LRS74_12665 [Streptomyces sp. LX-29]
MRLDERPSLVRRQAPRPVTPPARRLRHPFFAELRGGLALWVALVMCVAEALYMANAADYWQGSWAETRQYLHTTAVMLFGPFAAAAGCWQGARERRSRMAELRASGARGEFAQFLVVAVPVALAAVVGHAVAVTGSQLATWPYVPGGRPIFAPVAADLVFLAGVAVIGTVVGRLAPWRLAAPALAAVTYLLLAFLADVDSSARFLSPAADDGFHAEPVWWQPPAMMAWIGGLAVAAALAHTLRPRWSWVAVVPLAAAVAAAVPMARTGEDMWQLPDHMRKQVCDDSRPRVCVEAEKKDLLPKVSAALSGITGRLEGVDHLPDRFQLPQLYYGQSVVRGGLAEPEQFAWEAASMLLPDCENRPDEHLHNAVRDWLVSNDLSDRRRNDYEQRVDKEGDRQSVENARARARALSRLTSMDEDRRRAWLGRYFAATRACSGKVPAL